jgi:hypothetical protein
MEACGQHAEECTGRLVGELARLAASGKGLNFHVKGLNFHVKGLNFHVKGLNFHVKGLNFHVQVLSFHVRQGMMMLC